MTIYLAIKEMLHSQLHVMDIKSLSKKQDDCWLFLIINNNFHPSLRVKKENLLIPFLIPGPNQPKDFNTFLRPFVDEMKELESKNFIIFDYY